MKSTSIYSDGSSCQFLFANFARMKKPGSHLHWLHILLLVALFAGMVCWIRCSETICRAVW
ncbi:hypothetical protein FQN60_000832 [Etheostoma spectabile]|uniref:Uncharacterized protein n=1 Tax=Etheostoma spectabile TaxID=54343 RepID=A0A5J5D2R8_9PERO|nr:hypothetical protein FQN60_000832 [Etheostoma spectabile]